jgi:hypothetical protein
MFVERKYILACAAVQNIYQATIIFLSEEEKCYTSHMKVEMLKEEAAVITVHMHTNSTVSNFYFFNPTIINVTKIWSLLLLIKPRLV